MKKVGGREKTKAQSEIITTVLIILLVLAAIIIVWQVIKKTVTEGSSEISTGGITLGGTIKSFTIDTAQTTATLKLTRNSAAGNIIAIKFIFTDNSGNAYSYTETDTNKLPAPLETKEYTISASNSLITPALPSSSFLTIKKVEAYYIYIENKKERISNKISEKTIGETSEETPCNTCNAGCNYCATGICTNTALGYLCLGNDLVTNGGFDLPPADNNWILYDDSGGTISWLPSMPVISLTTLAGGGSGSITQTPSTIAAGNSYLASFKITENTNCNFYIGGGGVESPGAPPGYSTVATHSAKLIAISNEPIYVRGGWAGGGGPCNGKIDEVSLKQIYPVA